MFIIFCLWLLSLFVVNCFEYTVYKKQCTNNVPVTDKSDSYGIGTAFSSSNK